MTFPDLSPLKPEILVNHISKERYLYPGYASREHSWDRWLNKYFPWLLFFGVLANVSGLFITILEPDGALYATIAKTMVLSGDWINLKVEGKDWLDKPHFPFWVTAISYQLFGIGSVSYKVPALLFWAAGGFYTYQYARSVYNKNIARLSVLIYLTAAHLVISNNDVRAEPYLTGLIIGSVYHFYKASGKGLSIHLALGALLAAFGVMTKGPFVLIIIASGFIADWLVKKNWKEFIHYRWWLAVLLVCLFILPEIYCLYQQFDLHPTKIVFGVTGVSGIRFFFWDSQFGRFLNNGPIRGNGDPFFFIHTMLWAFLPWSLLFFAAVITGIRNIRANSFKTEAITIGCSLVTFLLFSLSRFQLPHYMNIVFPFFAIITAQYLYGMFSKKSIRLWSIAQHMLCFLLITLLFVITVYVNFLYATLIVSAVAVLYIGILYLFQKNNLVSMIGRSFLTAVLAYTFINVVLYPELLKYQSGSNAANFINDRKSGEIAGTYLENSYSFAFYLQQPVEYFYAPESIKARSAQGKLLIFTSEKDLGALVKSGLKVEVLKVLPHFHISQLTGPFLNYNTRSKVTKNMVIARILTPQS